jgi:hypothetical protein
MAAPFENRSRLLVEAVERYSQMGETSMRFGSDTAEGDRREEMVSHAGAVNSVLTVSAALLRQHEMRLIYMCFETHSTWRRMMSSTNVGSPGPCLVLG